jgi:hypothetical protein
MVKEKEGKVSVAFALSRLWAEFTDPGPAGDSLNMLKKYADCVVPGCAGLLFLGVGTLVIVVFSLQIDASDKRTYLPLVFGAVFALGGFFAFKLGLSSLWSKAGGRPPRNP